MTSFMLGLILLATPEARTLQEQGLAARKAIYSGEIEYEIAYPKPSPDPEAPLEWGRVLFRDRLVFDTRNGWYAFLERWRPDEIVALVNGESLILGHPGGGVLERIVVRPDVVFQAHPDPLSNGAKTAITEALTADQTGELKSVLHPWKFGMLPEIIGDHYDIPLETYVAPVKLQDTSVHADEIDGDFCWRVEYHRDKDRLVSVWFDVARGMNVRKVSEEGVNKLGRYEVFATSTLTRDETSGVWFPSQVLQTGRSTDKPADAMHERILITKARFNFEPALDQFTIKALNAIPHTSISPSYNKPGLSEKWDGEKVVPIGPAPPTVEPEARPRSMRSTLLILANVFAFVGLAVWFLTKRLRGN